MGVLKNPGADFAYGALCAALHTLLLLWSALAVERSGEHSTSSPEAISVLIGDFGYQPDSLAY